MDRRVGLAIGEEIAAYGFGDDHPFGYDRHGVFVDAITRQGLLDGLVRTPIRQAYPSIHRHSQYRRLRSTR